MMLSALESPSEMSCTGPQRYHANLRDPRITTLLVANHRFAARALVFTMIDYPFFVISEEGEK